MRKAICPITKEPLDCKNCKAVKDDRCPYFKFDECIEYTLKFIRELLENEARGN
jgi:hypothetical protein